ncbi:MAG: DNA methyltransferase [Thermoplasmata archaeon]
MSGIKITPVKGRSMLNWIDKKPIDYIEGYPVNLVELFDPFKSGKKINNLTYDSIKDNWQNLLFHGDNKETLSTLIELGFKEKIDLIYIDPPFNSGTKYSRVINLHGVNNVTPLQQIMYSDTWTIDNYLQFIYERLILMKDLLSDRGSIYVHCDYRASAFIKLILDEIFGTNNFVNEIIWQGATGNLSLKSKKYVKSHDTILFYEKTKGQHIWNNTFQKMNDDSLKRFKQMDEKGYFQWSTSSNPGNKGYVYDLGFGEKLPQNGYRMPKDTAMKWMAEGILKVEKGKVPIIKRYFNGEGVKCKDVWCDLKKLSSSERISYPTQKPAALLERIIKASSNEGDLVADFFCGSGTTLAVAEKLNRRWIGSDINKASIQVTSARLQNVIKNGGTKYSEFSVYNVNDIKSESQKGDEVKIKIERYGDKAIIEIEDFTSPEILKQLKIDNIAWKTNYDFRSIIDYVLIDNNYDGDVFRIVYSDTPKNKKEMVTGKYEIDLSHDKVKVAIKIVDLLGEEVIIVKEI